MNTHTILKFAASALVLGTAAVGCKPAADRPAMISSVAPKADKEAAKAAAKAGEALKARKFDDAIAAAEKAVALVPQNADHRALLGQAYLSAGRFGSAETSFGEALTLAPDHLRAGLSLALAQIALGRPHAARSTLAGLRGRVPDADVGLALALAGDKDGALAMLEPAARVEGADAKVRQNLALAYALAGRWAESMTVASQDVPANELPTRMAKWARFAQDAQPIQQVAALLGTTPASDPGRPERLALAPAAPVATETAAVEAAPVEPVPTEAVPAPVEVAMTDVPPSEPAPYVQPEIAPATMVEPVAAVQVAAAKPAAPLLAAPRRAGKGRYVVQLGAFSNPSRVETAWNRALGRVGGLGNYEPSSAAVNVRRVSTTVHRLVIGGFETRTSAMKVCAEVKARGGECFVRASAGERPMEWAARKRTERFAAMR